MGYLQQLDQRQMDESLAGAAKRNVPVTVAVLRDQSWVNLRSRILLLDDQRLLLEPPSGGDSNGPYELAPDESLSLSFKHKHHKHTFATKVIGFDRAVISEDTSVPAVAVNRPTVMERLQRRAYTRVAVPENRIVRVSFWLGGKDNEPVGPTPARPVWTATVSDISAGGFQANAPGDVLMAVEVGETFGLRMNFGSNGDRIFADAQFRHADPRADGQVLLGFQFLGLTESSEGKAALNIISGKVSEYQRIQRQLAARSRT